jgi:O-antigen/teichoic acid export membrane protein
MGIPMSSTTRLSPEPDSIPQTADHVSPKHALQDVQSSFPSSFEKKYSGASLRWNFSWTFAGNAVYSACQWGMLIVLAKIGSVEMVGQYGLALAISMPIFALANLQLRAVLTTDVRERIHFGDYLSFRLLTTLITVLVIAAVPGLMRYSWDSALIVVIIGLAQAIEAVSDVYWARMQFYDHMDRIAKSMTARALLALAAMAIGVYITHRLIWGAVGLMLARVVVLVGYDIRKRTHFAPRNISVRQNAGQVLPAHAGALRPRWNVSRQTELLRISLTLGVIALLITLLPSIPRYFIAGSLGNRALGIFTATASLIASGNLIILALGQSAFVRLAKHYAGGDLAGFNSLLFKLLKIGALLGLLGIGVAVFFGRQLLTLLYRPEYAEHIDLLIALTVAGALSYVASLLGSAVTSARFFKPQIPVLMTAAIAATISSMLLIPARGLLGAALSVVITSTVLCAGEVLLLWFVLKDVDRQLALNQEA